MKIVYLSNFFNHHQKPLSDAFYKLTDGNYWFIETSDIPEEQRLLGYHQYDVPYTVVYSQHKQMVDELIVSADIVIHGEAPVPMIYNRIKIGKLTFHDNERRYKSWIKYLKWPIYTYKSITLNKIYLLCASAFAARDFSLSGMSPSKCFKWAYYTEVKDFSNIDEVIASKSSNKSPNHVISILWACRFIKFKHPEMAVYLAKRLKDAGVNFNLQMIGRGPLEEKIKKLIVKYELVDRVFLLGSMTPEDVRTYMEKSDVFIATSDQNEGWGATVNESMSSACAVVASHAIGAVPFLIKDGENGLIFESENNDSLFQKVKYLIDNPQIRHKLSREAYFTMKNVWCAETASRNLIKLSKALINNEDSPILDGPCSAAPVINHTWIKHA